MTNREPLSVRTAIMETLKQSSCTTFELMGKLENQFSDAAMKAAITDLLWERKIGFGRDSKLYVPEQQPDHPDAGQPQTIAELLELERTGKISPQRASAAVVISAATLHGLMCKHYFGRYEDLEKIAVELAPLIQSAIHSAVEPLQEELRDCHKMHEITYKTLERERIEAAERGWENALANAATCINIAANASNDPGVAKVMREARRMVAQARLGEIERMPHDTDCKVGQWIGTGMFTSDCTCYRGERIATLEAEAKSAI